MKKRIIYLHGFNSSSTSIKALQLKEYIEKKLKNVDSWIPDLPLEPDNAINMCEKYIQDHIENEIIYIVGSSLGGFYSIYLAEKYNLKCIVINPAIHPDRYADFFETELDEILDGIENQWLERYIKVVKSYKVNSISKPEHFMLLAQQGDQLLDYKIAKTYFAKSVNDIEAGGSHNFEGFERKLPKIFEFLG